MADKTGSGTTIYTWGDNSAIPRIDDQGDGLAYIYASGQQQDLSQLNKKLRQQGWATLPISYNNNNNVLRIFGFDDIKDVMCVLAETGALKDSPTVKNVPAAPKKKFDLRSNMKRAAGTMYVVGNTLYMAYGFASKNKQFQQIGYTWNIADIVLTVFGGKDDKRDAALLTLEMKNYFDKNGITAKRGDVLSAEMAAIGKASLSDKDKISDLVHKHVTAIKSVTEVVGGGLMLKDSYLGRKANKLDPQEGKGWKQTGAAGGALVAGFGLAGVIKEKKYDPAEYANANPVKKLWMKIQARPLQLAGISGMINNVFNLLAVSDQHNEWKKSGGARPYLWRLAGVGALFSANVLYWASHKANDQVEDNTVTEELYSKAAQILERMPADAREIGIKQAAEFFGERTEIKESCEEAEARLRKEIDKIRSNPWFIAQQENDRAADCMQKAEASVLPPNPSVTAGIDQLEAFANDPANASSRQPTQPQQNAAMPMQSMQPMPNPALDSVSAGAAAQPQTSRVS